MTEQLPLFQRKTFHATLTRATSLKVPTPESTLLSALPAYYTYLQSQGYSSYTPGDFCGDINKFGRFLLHTPLQEIGEQEIRHWISHLRIEEQMTEKTISRKLAALMNFFTWLYTEQIITANPMARIPNRKVTAPLPDVLFEEECSKLLTAARGDTRTYLLVLLLLETGIKTEELMALQLANIDTSNKYAPEMWVKHQGKKVKKDRKLKLPQEIIPVLSEYIQAYRVADCVFPCTQRTVRYLLKAAGEKAHLKKPVSVHLLRDTCAVRLIKAGEALETVLKKLGLSETTWEDAKEKYLKLTSRAL